MLGPAGSVSSAGDGSLWSVSRSVVVGASIGLAPASGTAATVSVGVVVSAGLGVVTADRRIIERNHSNHERARPVYPSRPRDGERTSRATLIRTSAVVLTTGTFMRGLMHTGEHRTEGGRVGESASVGMSATLRRLGFTLGRLKTGTPPRPARETIAWDGLTRQVGDEEPVPASDLPPGALP